MTTNEETIKVSCRKCNAAPGSPCVYVLSKNLESVSMKSPAQIALVKRVGTPCVRFHNERFYDAWNIRVTRRCSVIKTTYSRPPRVTKAPTDQVLRNRANSAFESMLVLRAWLRQYADIFMEGDQ